MNITTNHERYFFAKACAANADKMWTFSLRQRDKNGKGSKEYKFWDAGFEKNLCKSNFWANVEAYYEDAVFKGISKRLAANLATIGMVPTKEEV